jgi:hypothetical protein
MPQRARRAALLLALAVGAAPGMGGCASTPGDFIPNPAAPAPAFDALAFFEGRSTGRGRLSKVFSEAVEVRVASEGVIGPDGALSLTQRIEEGDKAPRTRSWVLHETGGKPGRYEGTLTDANGPVTGFSQGNRLTLTYPMQGGFRVRQVLILAADGQSATNTLKVSIMGVTVAVLAEEIERVQRAGG